MSTLQVADRLLTLEGGDGVGKSTAITTITGVLARYGHEVVVTREPGGTKLGERLRAILLDAEQQGIDPNAELLTMFAARAQHVAEVIRPALARGAVVVSDRFTDSSFAYQGTARGLDFEAIAALERHFVGFRPSMTLLLDAPVEVARMRSANAGPQDRIEQEPDDFFSRVRRGFLDMAAADPDRFRVIDTARRYPEVIASIEDATHAWARRVLGGVASMVAA